MSNSYHNIFKIQARNMSHTINNEDGKKSCLWLIDTDKLTELECQKFFECSKIKLRLIVNEYDQSPLHLERLSRVWKNTIQRELNAYRLSKLEEQIKNKLFTDEIDPELTLALEEMWARFEKKCPEYHTLDSNMAMNIIEKIFDDIKSEEDHLHRLRNVLRFKIAGELLKKFCNPGGEDVADGEDKDITDGEEKL